jgi:hypothetical protein
MPSPSTAYLPAGEDAFAGDMNCTEFASDWSRSSKPTTLPVSAGNGFPMTQVIWSATYVADLGRMLAVVMAWSTIE